MDRYFLKKSLCFLGLLLLIITGGCQKDKTEDALSPKPTIEKKLNVVATIGMITDIANNVGGDRIDVTGIVGEGIDPHIYKPTARDTKLLKDADIIFYNGLNLEVKITGNVLDKLKNKTKAVAVTEEIDRSRLRVASEFLGGYDPHVWHDVSLWMKATEKVQDTLVKADPKNAEYYKINAGQYLASLKALHNDLQILSTQVPAKRKVLVTTHDAFGYLGRAYGFEVRGLMGINTEDEVGIADVRELAAFIIERKISTMFVETSAAPQGIQAVQAAVQAKGFNVKIGGNLFADAMGTPGTPEGTYVGMMRYNIDTITNSLQTELAYQE